MPIPLPSCPTRSRGPLTALCTWLACRWPTLALAAPGLPDETVADVDATRPPRASGLAHPWTVAAQVGGALTLPSVALALEGARPWRRFGVLAKEDWNRWVNTQNPPMLTRGTLNLGLGGEYWYFEGRVRTAVVAGPSILLFRYAVCNYIDTIAGNYGERRDGPRHSVLTDDCDHPEVEPLKDAAVLASTDLFNASLHYMDTGDLSEVDQALDKWLTLDPGCGYDAGYCGTPWAALAKRDETQPFGCSLSVRGAPGIPGLIIVLGALIIARRRR